MTLRPATPRSPSVARLIAELTPRPQPANDFFPAPYIPKGAEEDRALASLGLKRAPVRGSAPVARVAAWVLVLLTIFGALAMLLGAVVWVLDMLSALGGAA